VNPDAIIAALQHELESCNDPERTKAIREEIKATDGMERPPIIVDTAQLQVGDFDRAYLDALREELARSGKDRAKEIRAEIARAEKALKPEPMKEPAPSDEEEPKVSEQPTEQEIEERRQARTNQGVEQARNAPIPGHASPATTAPAQGAEETSTDE
jgi:hypothetical protein